MNSMLEAANKTQINDYDFVWNAIEGKQVDLSCLDKLCTEIFNSTVKGSLSDKYSYQDREILFRNFTTVIGNEIMSKCADMSRWKFWNDATESEDKADGNKLIISLCNSLLKAETHLSDEQAIDCLSDLMEKVYTNYAQTSYPFMDTVTTFFNRFRNYMEYEVKRENRSLDMMLRQRWYQDTIKYLDVIAEEDIGNCSSPINVFLNTLIEIKKTNPDLFDKYKTNVVLR